MLLILFFVAFVILVYLFLSTRRPVVIYEEPVPVTWWPWDITSYNWWPYWVYGSRGDYGSGGYGRTIHHKGPHRVPHHESRPWGGASRHANASAPLGGGHRGGPSGGHSGGSSGRHSGSGHR